MAVQQFSTTYDVKNPRRLRGKFKFEDEVMRQRSLRSQRLALSGALLLTLIKRYDVILNTPSSYVGAVRNRPHSLQGIGVKEPAVALRQRSPLFPTQLRVAGARFSSLQLGADVAELSTID